MYPNIASKFLLSSSLLIRDQTADSLYHSKQTTMWLGIWMYESSYFKLISGKSLQESVSSTVFGPLSTMTEHNDDVQENIEEDKSHSEEDQEETRPLYMSDPYQWFPSLTCDDDDDDDASKCQGIALWKLQNV
jgi:hypothetical protein